MHSPDFIVHQYTLLYIDTDIESIIDLTHDYILSTITIYCFFFSFFIDPVCRDSYVGHTLPVIFRGIDSLFQFVISLRSYHFSRVQALLERAGLAER